MKVRLDETLFKARAQENLSMTNDINKLEQVDALVECLDHFVADRKWVNEISRDELLTMVTQSNGDKEVLIESVLAKFNTPCIDTKKLKECKERRQNKGLKESMKTRKSLKESDNRDTFTLDTSNTPILNCGLYYTLLGELNPGRYDERFKEFEECVKECAKPILDELVRETPNFEVVSVGNYYHPRYYNYETDSLEFTVKYTGNDLGTVIEEYSNNQDFIDFLQNYKSYDGFISSFADNKEDFVKQDYVKSVSQIIKYNVTEEEYDEANENLYYDVMDCGFYPEDEDDFDESLKEDNKALDKGKMITNSKGVSYYQKGNKYYSNTGWLEKEITKDEFDKNVEQAFKEVDESLDELNVGANDKLKVKRARESKKLKEGTNTSDWDLMRKARDFTQEEVLKALKGVVSTKMYNDIKNDYKIAKLRHLTKSEQEKVAKKLEKKNIKESLKEASKQDNKFAYRIYMRDKDKDFASGKDYKDVELMLKDAKKDFELANNELRTNPKYLVCMLFDWVYDEYYHYKNLYSVKEIEDEIKLERKEKKYSWEYRPDTSILSKPSNSQKTIIRDAEDGPLRKFYNYDEGGNYFTFNTRDFEEHKKDIAMWLKKYPKFDIVKGTFKALYGEGDYDDSVIKYPNDKYIYLLSDYNIYEYLETKPYTYEPKDDEVIFVDMGLNESKKLKESYDKEVEKLDTFDDQMDFLAKDEQEAIDGYKKVINKVHNTKVKAQLKKIETEEKAHKDYLNKVKKNKDLEYTEPLIERKGNKCCKGKCKKANESLAQDYYASALKKFAGRTITEHDLDACAKELGINGYRLWNVLKELAYDKYITKGEKYGEEYFKIPTNAYDKLPSELKGNPNESLNEYIEPYYDGSHAYDWFYKFLKDNDIKVKKATNFSDYDEYSGVAGGHTFKIYSFKPTGVINSRPEGFISSIEIDGVKIPQSVSSDRGYKELWDETFFSVEDVVELCNNNLDIDKIYLGGRYWKDEWKKLLEPLMIDFDESLKEGKQPLYRVVKNPKGKGYCILKRVNKNDKANTFINDHSKEVFNTTEEAKAMLDKVDKLHFHIEESLNEEKGKKYFYELTDDEKKEVLDVLTSIAEFVKGDKEISTYLYKYNYQSGSTETTPISIWNESGEVSIMLDPEINSAIARKIINKIKKQFDTKELWVYYDKSDGSLPPEIVIKYLNDGKNENLKEGKIKIKDEIQRLVDKYSRLQKQYHGDSSASKKVEAEIDRLQCLLDMGKEYVDENLKEADNLQTRATKMLSVKKYQIDLAWKNGKTWKTDPMTLDEISKSVGAKVTEKQFVDMMSDNIKGRKDAKNLTKAEIVKLYDYMDGKWKGKDVLWSIKGKTNENLNEGGSVDDFLKPMLLSDTLERQPFISFAYEDQDGSTVVTTSWETTPRRAHSDYIKTRKFLGDKYNIDVLRQENRDGAKEFAYVMRITHKGK